MISKITYTFSKKYSHYSFDVNFLHYAICFLEAEMKIYYWWQVYLFTGMTGNGLKSFLVP